MKSKIDTHFVDLISKQALALNRPQSKHRCRQPSVKRGRWALLTTCPTFTPPSLSPRRVSTRVGPSAWRSTWLQGRRPQLGGQAHACTCAPGVLETRGLLGSATSIHTQPRLWDSAVCQGNDMLQPLTGGGQPGGQVKGAPKPDVQEDGPGVSLCMAAIGVGASFSTDKRVPGS